MALYRQVQTSFWQDVRVLEEMTPEDKLFYMYLMTNPQTRQIGVYQITKKTMAFELGYSMESVGSLLDRFERHHKIVKYNPETREIAILNWGKYNLNKGGKPIEDCVKKELGEVKDISLVRLVAERIKNDNMRKLFHEFLQNHESYDDTYVEHDDSFTIRGEKEKEEQEEKEEQQEKEDRTPAAPKQKVVVEISAIKFYEQNFGLITPFIAEDIRYWCDDLSEEVVVKAMQIALEQNKRNMAYVKSILRDWHGKGLTTLEQVESAQKEFERNRQKQQAPSLPTVRPQPEVTKQLLQKQEEWAKDVPSQEELQKFLEQNDWKKR